MREEHLLHDHRHVDLPVVEAVPQAIGHGPLGEERGPAPAHVLEYRGRPDDVQVRVLLAREGGGRQVLRRRTGSNGVGGLLAESGELAGDRRRQIVGDGDPFQGPADLRAERADRLPVVRLQARQLIQPIVHRRRFRHDPLEGVCRHAEASWHAEAFDPRKLPQVRALAANHRDLRVVNLLEPQHVAAHPLPPSCGLERTRELLEALSLGRSTYLVLCETRHLTCDAPRVRNRTGNSCHRCGVPVVTALHVFVRLISAGSAEDSHLGTRPGLCGKPPGAR